MAPEKFISILDVFEALQQRLSLKWVASRQETQRIIARPSGDKRTETLAGTLNYIHPNRLQVIGQTEIDYLNETGRCLYF
jgi:HPr kinase/phosphorylase